MEGWDGTPDGRPTELVRRRWTRFGESGAKLVWGGEAYAVEPSGRANPRQLARHPETEADLSDLRACVFEGHRTHGGAQARRAVTRRCQSCSKRQTGQPITSAAMAGPSRG